MPAPNTADLVTRGEPLPAAIRADIDELKAEVEKIIDGAVLPSGAHRLSLRCDGDAVLLSIVGYRAQAWNLRSAAQHLSKASDFWTRIRNQREADRDPGDLFEFDHQVGDAYDHVCAALEAELPIHTPAPLEQAA